MASFFPGFFSFFFFSSYALVTISQDPYQEEQLNITLTVLQQKRRVCWYSVPAELVPTLWPEVSHPRAFMPADGDSSLQSLPAQSSSCTECSQWGTEWLWLCHPVPATGCSSSASGSVQPGRAPAPAALSAAQPPLTHTAVRRDSGPSSLSSVLSHNYCSALGSHKAGEVQIHWFKSTWLTNSI